jgi:hypothetical protein
MQPASNGWRLYLYRCFEVEENEEEMEGSLAVHMHACKYAKSFSSEPLVRITEGKFWRPEHTYRVHLVDTRGAMCLR